MRTQRFLLFKQGMLRSYLMFIEKINRVTMRKRIKLFNIHISFGKWSFNHLVLFECYREWKFDIQINFNVMQKKWDKWNMTCDMCIYSRFAILKFCPFHGSFKSFSVYQNFSYIYPNWGISTWKVREKKVNVKKWTFL